MAPSYTRYRNERNRSSPHNDNGPPRCCATARGQLLLVERLLLGRHLPAGDFRDRLNDDNGSFAIGLEQVVEDHSAD